VRIVDFVLRALYLFENPFRICRKAFEKRGEKEIHMYGETPLALWKKIAEAASITKEDCFLDLGSGRGLLCFWTRLVIGSTVIGVDWVPTFIQRARWCSSIFRISDIRFLCCSLKEAPLDKATVLYLYTYHPDEELLDFSQLSPGARVITVSEPLSCKGFRVSKIIEMKFPWGKTEVYINDLLC
jgi:SAM-dependent methyltransferase